MGFYVRKSIKSGPFRINLSGSGIGVSVGVPGLRVGSGPRGNYVHMGRGGVYYRKTLAPTKYRTSGPQQPAGPQPVLSTSALANDTLQGTLVGWTGAGPSEFVDQLNRARRARASWGWAALLTCVAASLVAAQASPEIRTDSPNYLFLALAAIVALLGAVATYLLYGWDCTRRQVAVFYDVEDEAAARFQWVVESCEATATAAAWELVASSDRLYGHTQKVNAGASNLLKRERLMRHMNGPKHLRTNVPLPSFTMARTALYLLPDRALAHTPSGYVEIGYRNLACSYNAARFIETNPVPPDAPVVDTTWQAVNKDGSPDRRFNNNRQIPVVLYGELALWHVATTQSVPITTWQLSNPGRAEQLAQVFEHLRTT